MTRAPCVLHVQRRDHEAHVGGDLVQLAATVEGLRAAGVDVVAATVEDAPAHVDVVHVYNLQRPGALWHDLRLARQRWPAAAIAVSPVWWPLPIGTMVRTRQRDVASFAVKWWLKRTGWWPYVRTVLRRADLVLPNSHLEVAALQRVFRLRRSAADEHRWAVVPNGIDLEQWPMHRAPTSERTMIMRELGLDVEAAPLVACVARVEAVKNQLALVRAAELLPDAALVLIGPTDERYAAIVRAAAASPSARGRVAFAGRLPHDEVARLLAAVDVHVLASFRETPGLATLEAAATGCAVVASTESSTAEYLGDSVRLADPADPTSIATAVAAAATDDRQPAARERVAEHDWSRAVDALLAAYRRLPGWPPTRS